MAVNQLNHGAPQIQHLGLGAFGAQLRIGVGDGLQERGIVDETPQLPLNLTASHPGAGVAESDHGRFGLASEAALEIDRADGAVEVLGSAVLRQRAEGEVVVGVDDLAGHQHCQGQHACPHPPGDRWARETLDAGGWWLTHPANLPAPTCADSEPARQWLNSGGGSLALSG